MPIAPYDCDRRIHLFCQMVGLNRIDKALIYLGFQGIVTNARVIIIMNKAFYVLTLCQAPH